MLLVVCGRLLLYLFCHLPLILGHRKNRRSKRMPWQEIDVVKSCLKVWYILCLLFWRFGTPFACYLWHLIDELSDMALNWCGPRKRQSWCDCNCGTLIWQVILLLTDASLVIFCCWLMNRFNGVCRKLLGFFCSQHSRKHQPNCHWWDGDIIWAGACGVWHQWREQWLQWGAYGWRLWVHHKEWWHWYWRWLPLQSRGWQMWCPQGTCLLPSYSPCIQMKLVADVLTGAFYRYLIFCRKTRR